jgi:hypothetical protein
MELAVGKCVSRQEMLRLVEGLEALHLPVSPACRSMRVLSTIVAIGGEVLT